MRAKSGYATPRFEGEREFRAMTAGEAQCLRPGDVLMFLDREDKIRECRVTGRPKTWETRPNHVRVPIKYGMYENAYAEIYGDSADDAVLLPTGQPIVVDVLVRVGYDETVTEVDTLVIHPAQGEVA